METQEHRDDHAEIIRLRERVHRLTSTVGGLSWRLRLTNDQVKELRQDVKGLRKEVDSMLRADEIADAVAAKVKTQMTERNQLLTTWPRRIGAAAAGAIIVADALKGLVHL